MFNILTYVWVAPATADVYIILEVPATDKNHIEDWYSLAELSQTMGYTTRKTVNWFARKQLHFSHVVPEGTKGALNLFIELEKRNLNQIDGRNIRTSLQKRVVSRSKATASPKKKPDVGEYDMPDKRHTAVKWGARAQFPPKLSLNKVLNFPKFSLSSPKLQSFP